MDSEQDDSFNFVGRVVGILKFDRRAFENISKTTINEPLLLLVLTQLINLFLVLFPTKDYINFLSTTLATIPSTNITLIYLFSYGIGIVFVVFLFLLLQAQLRIFQHSNVGFKKTFVTLIYVYSTWSLVGSIVGQFIFRVFDYSTNLMFLIGGILAVVMLAGFVVSLSIVHDRSKLKIFSALVLSFVVTCVIFGVLGAIVSILFVHPTSTVNIPKNFFQTPPIPVPQYINHTT